MANNFGELVKSKRKRLGMTAEDLAKKIGVDRTYISKIENLNLAPALPTYGQICNILGISLKDNRALMSTKGGKKKAKFLKEIFELIDKEQK